MSRLIDKDKLDELVEEPFEKFLSRLDLRCPPTIDAEPIRHGHWEDKYNDGDWHCSVCGAIVEKDEQKRHNWYRCYHCGAKMDEVEDGR